MPLSCCRARHSIVVDRHPSGDSTRSGPAGVGETGPSPCAPGPGVDSVRRGALIVRGEDNKERITSIDDGAAEPMGIWITARGEELGPLFSPISKLGRQSSTR